MLREMREEGLLSLIVPVGLLDRAAAMTHRTMGAAGPVAAEFVRRQVLLLEDLDHLEIRKFNIARVLQHQRLGTVADHHPFAVADQQAGHEFPSSICTSLQDSCGYRA